MHQSHFIEIGGTLIGGAITSPAGYRFRAAHPRVESLNGTEWPSLATLRTTIGRAFMAAAACGVPAREADSATGAVSP